MEFFQFVYETETHITAIFTPSRLLVTLLVPLLVPAILQCHSEPSKCLRVLLLPAITRRDIVMNKVGGAPNRMGHYTLIDEVLTPPLHSLI